MKKHLVISVLTVGALMCSCNDTWNDHYTENAAMTGDGASLMEQLQADPELTTFVKMIEIAGYADELSSSQTFTVWAPVNSSLSDVDLTNKAEVTRTVANHIARFNISSATPFDEGVKMLNGKLLYFSENSAEFGGVRLLTSDIHTANGLLHKISSTIPYAYNFREYIDTHNETSEIAAFLARFDELLLPADVPLADATTSTDTTRVPYNRLLEYPIYGLGNIASEDSLFSMVIPTNTAWQKAFDEILPYFTTYNADSNVADSIQRAQTALAIVNDLIYRTGLKSPLAEDSLISTSGSVISNPSAFFSGMQEVSASNGRMFIANTLNYDMTETFNKPIRIEAEEQTGRTPAAGSTIYTRNVSTDNIFANEISGQSYIEVTPTSSSRQPGVTFEIPNTLAGAYDIYVSFVPGNVTDLSNTTDSTRLQFAITYMNTNGRSTSKSYNDKSFITSGSKITLMKVAEAFQFPVANYYDRVWYTNPKNNPNDRSITASIYISTNVTNTEFNQNLFTRRFRVDRVILVPVKTDSAK